MTKKRIFTYVTDEIKEKLEKIAKKKKIKVSPLIEDIINEYFEEDTDELNKHYVLYEDCTMLRYLEEDEAPAKKGEGYYCFKKSPKVELLGSGIKEAKDKYCETCKAKINLEERWKQIKVKPFEEHTYCIEGGMIDYNRNRIQCRETDYKGKRIWHDMDKCFTYFKGGRCPSLKTLSAKPIKKTGIRRRYKR